MIDKSLIDVIGGIGDVAIKYAIPINQLATGLNNIANALSRIQSISITPIALDGIKQLGNISSNSGRLVGAGSGNVPIEVTVHSTLVLEDGTKLAEHISKAIYNGTRGGGN